MNKHSNHVLLGVIVGVSVTVATVLTLSMGQPADITSDTGYPTATQDSAGTVESSTGQAPTNSVDDDRSATDGIACFTPTDEGTPENLAGCQFNPHKRYDYVGSGFGKGAWVVVPDDYVFDNGNRPPTGAELNATRDGTYDREVEAGS